MVPCSDCISADCIPGEAGRQWVPYVAVAAPLLCFVSKPNETAVRLPVGYELLLVNAALTGTGLWICR